MTHCVDCGAERSTDQCPVCGLTSRAAELVFRRRLLKQMAAFLVGSLAFVYVIQVYPPLDMDGMLVFYGVVFFLALFLAVMLERRARAGKELEILRHLFSGLIPLPFIFGLALFLNGRLDTPKNLHYRDATVEGRYQMKGIVRGSRRVFVNSWRPGHHVERLAVDADDFDRFNTGDHVVVAEGPGALGIPWFYGIYRH